MLGVSHCLFVEQITVEAESLRDVPIPGKSTVELISEEKQHQVSRLSKAHETSPGTEGRLGNKIWLQVMSAGSGEGQPGGMVWLQQEPA